MIMVILCLLYSADLVDLIDASSDSEGTDKHLPPCRNVAKQATANSRGKGGEFYRAYAGPATRC